MAGTDTETEPGTATGAGGAKRLLVVANVPSANTRALAAAVAAGAADEAVEGVDVVRLAPLEAGPDDVLGADAVLLGTTENFGYMSGAVKDFLERIYHPCLERTEGLPWALWVRAGQDGVGARDSVTRIVTGLRWRAIRPPLVLSGPWRDGFADECRELGLTMAASLEAGIV